MELKQSVAAIENGTEDPLVEAASFLADMKQKTLVEKTKNRGPLLGLMQLALVLDQKGLSQQTKELCGERIRDLCVPFVSLSHYTVFLFP